MCRLAHSAIHTLLLKAIRFGRSSGNRYCADELVAVRSLAPKKAKTAFALEWLHDRAASLVCLRKKGFDFLVILTVFICAIVVYAGLKAECGLLAIWCQEKSINYVAKLRNVRFLENVTVCYPTEYDEGLIHGWHYLRPFVQIAEVYAKQIAVGCIDTDYPGIRLRINRSGGDVWSSYEYFLIWLKTYRSKPVRRIFDYSQSWRCTNISGFRIELPDMLREFPCGRNRHIQEGSLHELQGLAAYLVGLDHLCKLTGIDTGEFHANDNQQNVQNELRPISTVPPLRFCLMTVGVVIACLGLILLLRIDGPNSGIAAIVGILCVVLGFILARWSVDHICSPVRQLSNRR